MLAWATVNAARRIAGSNIISTLRGDGKSVVRVLVSPTSSFTRSRMDSGVGDRAGGGLPSGSAPASPSEARGRASVQQSAPTYQPFPSFPPTPQPYNWPTSAAPPAAAPLPHPAFSAQSLAAYHPSPDYRIPPFQRAYTTENPLDSPLETLQQHQATYGFAYPNHPNRPLPRPHNDVGPPLARPPSNYTPLGAHSAKSAPPDWRNPRLNHPAPNEQSGNWQERNRSAGEGSTSLPPSWEYAATPVERSEALARGVESAQNEAARWSWENSAKRTLRDWNPQNIPSPLLNVSGGLQDRAYAIGEVQQFRDGSYGSGDGSGANGDSLANGNGVDGTPRKQRRKNGEPPRDLAQRRYACELCSDRSFARPSALAIHMVRLHSRFVENFS